MHTARNFERWDNELGEPITPDGADGFATASLRPPERTIRQNSNTVGRGMKVAKDEIVGLVAAVDWFLGQDDAAVEAEYRKRAELIADHLKSVPTVQSQLFVPAVANHVPHLLITYDLNRIKITGAEVMQKMRQGNPRIELNPSTGGPSASAGLPGGSNTIVVGVWMMQPGEDLAVAKRLRDVLQDAMRG
jgi:L-seryl-tRNA(Ser) seleniumtransferase